jgi:uncharacterized protein
MKTLHILALALVVVGGLNWGLVGAFDFNLVSAIFGEGSFLSRTIFALVGLSAIWVAVAVLPQAARQPETATAR